MRHQQQHTPAGMWTAKRRPAALPRGSSGPRPRAGRHARPPQWGGQPSSSLDGVLLNSGGQGLQAAACAPKVAVLAGDLIAGIVAGICKPHVFGARQMLGRLCGAGNFGGLGLGHGVSPVWASHRALPMSSNVPMLDTLRKRRFVKMGVEAGRPTIELTGPARRETNPRGMLDCCPPGRVRFSEWLGGPFRSEKE